MFLGYSTVASDAKYSEAGGQTATKFETQRRRIVVGVMAFGLDLHGQQALLSVETTEKRMNTAPANKLKCRHNARCQKRFTTVWNVPFLESACHSSELWAVHA